MSEKITVTQFTLDALEMRSMTNIELRKLAETVFEMSGWTGDMKSSKKESIRKNWSTMIKDGLITREFVERRGSRKVNRYTKVKNISLSSAK